MAAKKRAAADPCLATVTTARLAKFLDLTPHRVRQLIKEGHIEKAGPDRLVLETATRGYIRFRNDADRRSSKSASASRVQDARAREIELKTAEREGSLMDVEEVRAVVAEWGGVIRTGLNSIPARLSRDMTFRRKIETEIDDVFRQATERFESAMGDRSAAGAAAEADAGDDA